MLIDHETHLFSHTFTFAYKAGLLKKTAVYDILWKYVTSICIGVLKGVALWNIQAYKLRHTKLINYVLQYKNALQKVKKVKKSKS